MESTTLSVLPHLRNEKVSFFGIDVVFDRTSSTFFVSVDRIYCGSFEHNLSGCMVSFTNRLSSRETLILICNLKKEIPSFLSSKASSGLNLTHFPPSEKNPLDVGYPHIGYYNEFCLLGISLFEILHSYQCRVCLRIMSSHRLLHLITR